MKRETRIAGAVFTAIPMAILSAATLCTFAIAHGASPLWKLLFRVMCHGMPERSLTLWNVQMPICARCTGIYIGLFTGLVLYVLMPWLEERLLRFVAWLAVLPLALDGTTQALRLRHSTNSLRMATGLLAGLAFGMWVLSAIEKPATTLATEEKN